MLIIKKNLKLGRLESSEDFKAETKTSKPKVKAKTSEIESLKIKVRLIEAKDIEERNLPKNTKGLVITEIANDSPINYLEINDIIIEAQKKRIRSINDLENIVNQTLKSSEKTILILIYNNQNQRRYFGVKLD